MADEEDFDYGFIMNLIYQYWDGEILESCKAGVDAMRQYAREIGVEHRFDDNPNFVKSWYGQSFGVYTPHFGILKLIYDTSFDDYDDILFLDADVFPVETLDVNIFDHFQADIGIVSEGFVGDLTEREHSNWYEWNRLIKDVYGITIPTRKDGLPRILNGGVVLFSKQARLQAREQWMDLLEYNEFISQHDLNRFYMSDQPYIHMMIYLHNMNVQLMDGEWNSQLITELFETDGIIKIHHHDYRKEDTKFVHVRLAHADLLSGEDHHALVNFPKDLWPDYILNSDYLREMKIVS